MRVTFNELAERELNDVAQYYEYEQSGLGAAFIAEPPVPIICETTSLLSLV